jgi:hypothetical protein
MLFLQVNFARRRLVSDEQVNVFRLARAIVVQQKLRVAHQDALAFFML